MKFLNQIDGAKDLVQDSNNRLVTDTEKSTWNSKSDTDTVTTINGKTGAITKADITALGIPAQDTVYTHPASHPASMITDLPTGKKVARFVVGTSTAGWTAADCDYLCDGTADQTEINAAINALPATGGEIVILDGTYNLAAKIVVTKDNVSIRGNGDATILKRMFDSDMPEGLITLIGRSGCKIANLQIEGSETDYGTNYIIYLENSNNNIVTGNTCNKSYYGIYLENSSDNIVTSNTCNNTECGIYLYASSNNTVTGNTCHNNTAGIYLESSNDNTVTGNTCNNNDYGIYVEGSNSNAVTGNTCNFTGYGIYLFFSSHNAVTGNISNSNTLGIFLGTSNNNTVTSNTCNNNDYGIFLEVSSRNTITGNTCMRGIGLSTEYSQNQYTIMLYSTGNNYNLISNNNCMGKAPVIEGGTGNSVYGNKYDSGDYKDFTQDEKTKLAGIAASANNYAHPTTAGNKHIPTGGASGQILRYSASGTAIWGADNDTITTINGKTGTIAKADIVALGVPAQDTVYTHPANHPASIITQDASNRFVTDTEKATWDAKGTSNLTLGTTSLTAYRGDYGNTAYTHSQSAHAPSGAQVNQTLTSGNGMAAWTATNGNLTIPLGTPSTLTTATTNAVTTTSHTHSVTFPVTSVAGKTGAVTLGPTDVGAAAATHSHGTYDRATAALTGANVFSDLVVVDGIVTGISTRALTLANLGYTGATNANYYTHPSGDGNLHVPATSTTNNGKVLKAGTTAGSLSWATDNDTITTINGKTGAITKADITALGIPAQDTVYTHPANHPASVITQDASNRFVTDAEKTAWNAKGTSNLALGTTSSTAYRGDYGNIAYTHSQATHAPTNAVANQILTSGSGMAAWTATSGDLTITLGTPSTLTTATTNAVTTTSHTHSVTFPVTSVAGKTGAVTLGPTDVGAAASSHTHSYLPLSGGTVTGGITKTTTPSSRIGGKTATNVLYFGAITESYHPMIRVNDWDGNVWNLGGYENFVGFYGYHYATTDDKSDWYTHWDTATGFLIHSESLQTGGSIYEAGTALSSKYAAKSHTHDYVPTTRTVNSKALSANIALTAADVGAAASTHAHGTYDRATSALTGANVFSDIVVVDGIVTGTTTRALTAANIGAAPSSHTHDYVPTTRTVNSKALSANITLTAADVGAAATSHGNHVPTTGTANSAIFLRNDNTWQTVTPANIGAAPASHTHSYVPTTRTVNSKALSANISLTAADVGAAPSSHTHAYVPTSRTVNGKALSANISLTAANVGAAASSHTHSYLPLSGGTVTGGITKTTTASSWVSGKTATNVLYFGSVTQSSYHPMIRVNSYSGHVWNLGGLGNSVGFYGFYSSTTDNKTEWSTYWNTASGTLTHSTTLAVGGNIYEGGTALVNKYAAKSHTHSYVPTSRTVNGKALSANISLTAADVGAAATSHKSAYTLLRSSIAVSGNTSITFTDSGQHNMYAVYSYDSTSGVGAWACTIVPATTSTTRYYVRTFVDCYTFKFGRSGTTCTLTRDSATTISYMVYGIA